MKGKGAVVVLVVIALALAIGLLLRHRSAVEQQKADEARKQMLSNQVAQTEAQLNEQKRVNLTLENSLSSRVSELLSVSNKLVATSVDLARTVADAQAAARTAQEEMAKRDTKISQLEGQNDELTKKMSDLNVALADLEKQISETERKLAASEGDREFLMKELGRLQAEKRELERQFNDLALLRDQIRKLKDELSIARRLEWIRRGLYGSEQRGAEKLQPGFATPANKTNLDLNVEIRQDGSAPRIVSPTNAPANPPAQ
jgi:chromosome segregation ATPase